MHKKEALVIITSKTTTVYAFYYISFLIYGQMISDSTMQFWILLYYLLLDADNFPKGVIFNSSWSHFRPLNKSDHILPLIELKVKNKQPSPQPKKQPLNILQSRSKSSLDINKGWIN